MYTLGINLSHHSSVALLHNNEVLMFIHEERLSRKKYHHGIPYKSLDLIKNYTNQIDFLSYISGSQANFDIIIQYLAKQGVSIKRGERDNGKHHLAHAAAGFYMSHFDHAIIFVVDGAGAITKFNSKYKASETTSIYAGSFPNINCVSKKFVVGLYNKRPIAITQAEVENFKHRYKDLKVEVTTTYDIGWRYAAVTSKIGFGVFGEGKTMGLSAYGFPGSTDNKAKLAYEIQKSIEQSFVSMVSKVESNNVVISGGCALNILGNSKIKSVYPNLNIFIDPIAADGTISLGAAAYHYYSHSHDRNKLHFGPYLGPQYSLSKDYIYECSRKYSI
jgi:carbamoyltransferase